MIKRVIRANVRGTGRAALAGGALALACALLSSCASERGAAGPRIAASQPLRAPEALWHLRAGLNVAALSCRGRGRTALDGSYRTMLKRHRALLEAAYRGELERYGERGYDRHLTKIYNRFANQRSPESFCKGAAGLARQASGMDSARLASDAPGLLAELERLRR